MRCPECGYEFSQNSDGQAWVCPECFARCSGESCPACGKARPESGEETERKAHSYPVFLPKARKRRANAAIIALSALLALSLGFCAFLLFGESIFPAREIAHDYFTGVEGNGDVHEAQINSFYLPAHTGEPVRYADYEYELGGDRVWCKYDITLIDAFRGEAAAEMVDGNIPPLSDGEELFIAQFRIDMIEQHKECEVAILPSSFLAFESQSVSFPRVNLSVSDADTELSFSVGENRTVFAVFAVKKGSQPVLGYRNESIVSGAFFAQ